MFRMLPKRQKPYTHQKLKSVHGADTNTTEVYVDILADCQCAVCRRRRCCCFCFSSFPFQYIAIHIAKRNSLRSLHSVLLVACYYAMVLDGVVAYAARYVYVCNAKRVQHFAFQTEYCFNTLAARSLVRRAHSQINHARYSELGGSYRCECVYSMRVHRE